MSPPATGLLLGFAAVALTMSGCGAGTVGSRDPGRAPPPYVGHATELFDDAIEATAVGYNLEGRSSQLGSTLLRERVQLGDAVARARVTTVTSKDEDKGRAWQVDLHTVERLAGRPEADFEIRIDPSGPSAGILRAVEGRLIGKTFVVFVREYAREGSPGDSDLRFHLAPDDKDEIEAVRAAVE